MLAAAGYGQPSVVDPSGATAFVPQSYDQTIALSYTFVGEAVIDAGDGSLVGTSAQTLDAFTSTASGTVTAAFTGTSARTLGTFTSSATGAVQVTATSAQTLGSFTSSAAGSVGAALILFDDFTGSSVNQPEPWAVYNRLGDGLDVPNEVDAVLPANVRVSSGTLKIDQKYESVEARDTTTSAPNPRTVQYTSGQIAQSTVRFQYGRVEVRAKIPGGTGLWPCIWMLGHLWQASQPYTANVAIHNWPNGGWWEIDIAEFMSDHRTVVNNALHFITANRAGSGEKSLPFNATTRFMVYRLDWTPTSLTWYVDAEDGVGWRTLTTITGVAGTDIPNTPGYLIIHCAVGGAGASTSSPPSTAFPQVMEVDYAKITATSDTVALNYGATTLSPFTSTASGNTGGITGTSARTLGAFTSTAAGTLNESGTSSRTLGNFTSTASGTLNEAGTSAQTLGSFVSSAAGTSTPPGVTGTSAQTLGSFTPSAAGRLDESGTSAQTLGTFTPTAAGTYAAAGVSGTSATTLGSFTSTAAGTVNQTGTSATTLGTFTPSAAGTLNEAGTSAQTLGTFTSTASGSFIPSGGGVANPTLGNFTPAAAGTVTIAPITGTSARTLGTFTATASGASAPPGNNGTSSRTLGTFASSAAGTYTSPGANGSAADALGQFLAVAAGTVTIAPITGTSARTLGAFTSHTDTLHYAAAATIVWNMPVAAPAWNMSSTSIVWEPT